VKTLAPIFLCWQPWSSVEGGNAKLFINTRFFYGTTQTFRQAIFKVRFLCCVRVLIFLLSIFFIIEIPVPGNSAISVTGTVQSLCYHNGIAKKFWYVTGTVQYLHSVTGTVQKYVLLPVPLRVYVTFTITTNNSESLPVPFNSYVFRHWYQSVPVFFLVLVLVRILQFWYRIKHLNFGYHDICSTVPVHEFYSSQISVPGDIFHSVTGTGWTTTFSVLHAMFSSRIPLCSPYRTGTWNFFFKQNIHHKIFVDFLSNFFSQQK